MVVLCVHNYYQQPGGEDLVLEAEAELLAEHGHRVVRYTVHNDVIANMSRLRLAPTVFWNHKTYRDIRRTVQRERPEVVHFHNTFPLISSSAFYAAKAEGASVVQTLHNYRLLCPNALLFRDGRVCEDCVGKALPWPGVLHACYRDSVGASLVSAGALSLHRGLGTRRRKVDQHIALTRFARQKLLEGGLPESRVSVKPNFLRNDPGVGPGGKNAVFVGRLTAEKGIGTLLEAWRILRVPVPLEIFGDGPMAAEVSKAVSQMPNVQWHGQRSHAEVLSAMKRSYVAVFPSMWYEGFPLTIVEALATGLPIIASRIGSIPSVVEDGRTGLLFEPGSHEELAKSVTRAFGNKSQLATMRRAARLEYEQQYTADRNYEQLMEVYRRATGRHRPDQHRG